ncbi:hypothetical protein E2320_014003 [Naja naja]|nr:hypothetical protein E2320_014003 [Naja naja]
MVSFHPQNSSDFTSSFPAPAKMSTTQKKDFRSSLPPKENLCSPKQEPPARSQKETSSQAEKPSAPTSEQPIWEPTCCLSSVEKQSRTWNSQLELQSTWICYTSFNELDLLTNIMAHSLHYSINGGSQQPSKDYLEWHLVNLQDFSSDCSATLNILPTETYFVVNMSQQQQQQGSCCHGGSSGLGGGCCRRGSSGGCCSRGTTGGGGCCCCRRGSSGGCCSRGTGAVYVQQSQQTTRCCCINRSGPCCGRCCGRRCGGGCCGGGSTQLKQK